MQNKADVSGRCVEAPQIEEATPLGAAILAGIGVGVYDDEQDACNHVYRPGATFEPNPERMDFYARGFELYQRIYPALKPLNDLLAEG
jgi:xylulokinase